MSLVSSLGFAEEERRARKLEAAKKKVSALPLSQSPHH
jgi:hypothetical protein